MKIFNALIVPLLIVGLSAEAQVTNHTTVNGSVFVVLKNATNIKLALAQVHVMSEPVFEGISEKVKPMLDEKIKELASKYFTADVAGQHETKIQILDELKNLVENTYFDAFPKAITKSDADGKFTLTFDDLEPKIIACHSARQIVDETEFYYWAFKFQPMGKAETVMFSNDNMNEKNNILNRGSVYFFSEVEKLKEARAKLIQDIIAQNAKLRAETAAKKRAETLANTIKWNLSNAEKGDSYSQFRMGMRYLNGEGVEKNEAAAIDWLKKAAAQGRDDAKKELEKIQTSKN